MVPFGSRKGEAGARTLPLMILAFVVAGAFFTWLYFQAAPVGVLVLEGPDETVDDGQVARIITIEVFAEDPMAQAGLLIQVHALGVRSLVGSGAFFVGLPPAESYLVRMLPEVVADSLDIENQSTVSVTGTVYAMSDSVADSWVASGVIAESDRVLAIFAESYLEARAVRVTAPPPPQP